MRDDQPIRAVDRRIARLRPHSFARLRQAAPTINALPDRCRPVKPGGLGLMFMRNAFDKVDYILKPRGTELVLTKKHG